MISKRNSNFYRGIAILIVMANHYACNMYVEPVRQGIRNALTTWGPYGVDIFFLLSGYGLVKAASKGVDWNFVLRRILSVYLPYLLIMLVINLYTGGFSDIDAHGWFNLLTGYDYWYMNILFIFYILFMVIWKLERRLRLPLITVGVVITTVVLYNLGRADFWELSNGAFLIGIYAATLENYKPELIGRKIFQFITLAAALVCFVIFTILMIQSRELNSDMTFTYTLISDVFFSIMVWALCLLTPDIGWVLPLIGSQSMYIYLTHMFIFWQLTFSFDNLSYLASTVIVGLISLIIGTLIGYIYNILYKRIMRGKR